MATHDSRSHQCVVPLWYQRRTCSSIRKMIDRRMDAHGIRRRTRQSSLAAYRCARPFSSLVDTCAWRLRGIHFKLAVDAHGDASAHEHCSHDRGPCHPQETCHARGIICFRLDIPVLLAQQVASSMTPSAAKSRLQDCRGNA